MPHGQVAPGVGSRTGGRGKDPGQGFRREQGRPGESRSRRLGQSGPGGAWSGRSLRRTRKATAADRSQYRCAAHGYENGLGDRGHAARDRVSPGRKASAESMRPVAATGEDGPQSVGAIARHANERAGLARPGMGANERPSLTMRMSMGGRSTAWVGGIRSWRHPARRRRPNALGLGPGRKSYSVA